MSSSEDNLKLMNRPEKPSHAKLRNSDGVAAAFRAWRPEVPYEHTIFSTIARVLLF